MTKQNQCGKVIGWKYFNLAEKFLIGRLGSSSGKNNVCYYSILIAINEYSNYYWSINY